MNAHPLGRSSTLYKQFCNFLKRLLEADALARGPCGPGSGVPSRPVRWDGWPRSGVDGSLRSVWTAVRATNSTRLSSFGAGGASILMPPLFDGLPNILRPTRFTYIWLLDHRKDCRAKGKIKKKVICKSSPGRKRKDAQHWDKCAAPKRDIERS